MAAAQRRAARVIWQTYQRGIIYPSPISRESSKFMQELLKGTPGLEQYK